MPLHRAHTPYPPNTRTSPHSRRANDTRGGADDAPDTAEDTLPLSVSRGDGVAVFGVLEGGEEVLGGRRVSWDVEARGGRTWEGVERERS